MRLFTTLICSSLIFVSCKKKEKETKNVTPSQTTYEPQEINASLWNEKQFQVINGNLVPFNGLTTLIMFDSLRNKDAINLPYGVDAGTVAVNSVALKKQTYVVSSSSSYYYTDTLSSIFSKPCNWSITGNGNVPPINFSDYSIYPSYLGYNNLPDTLMAYQSNTITINSYYGADKIFVQLRGNGGSVSKTIDPPANLQIISPTDLAQIFNAGSNFIQISIYFSRTELRNIDGKVFQIENAIDVWKNDVYIKE